jgi:hypothetical protein
MPTIVSRDNDDAVTDLYIAQKNFTYKGKRVHRGEFIPYDMLSHLRFDSYLGSGLIRGAKR